MSNVRKVFSCVVLMCCMVSVLCGCQDKPNYIYDDNSKIARQGDTYSKSQSNSSVNNENCKFTMKITGMQTIWRYDCKTKGDEVKVDYDFYCKDGEAKLVLIDPDDNVTTIAELSGDDQVKKSVSYQLNKGKYRIKIVGAHDGDIKLNMNVNKGEWDDPF